MKVKVKPYFFLFSMPMIFVAIENSFTIQSVALIIMLMIISTRKVKLTRMSIYMIALTCSYTVSLITAMFFWTDAISFMSIIRLLYFFCIAIYVIIAIGKDITKEYLRLSVDMYVWTSDVISLMILINYINGMKGKLTIVNLLGNKIDPNIAGAILVIAAIFALIKLVYAKAGRRQCFLIVQFCLISFATMLTGSRAALVALIASCVILIFVSFFENKSLKQKVMFFLTIIVLCIIAVNLLEYLPSFITHRFFQRSYVDASNTDRMTIWFNAIDGWTESPIFGYGIGNFSEYHPSRLNLITTSVYGNFVAHNTYLDVLVDGGVIGFTIFMLMGLRIFKRNFDKRCNLLLSVFSGMFITSFIFGASKTVYFWYVLIVLNNIQEYCIHMNCDLKDILGEQNE